MIADFELGEKYAQRNMVQMLQTNTNGYQLVTNWCSSVNERARPD